MIDCKERVDAYFRNMALYEKDYDIRVRFLYKIYKAFTDPDYTVEEKTWILEQLLEITSKEEDLYYKVLNLCFCYKMNKIYELSHTFEIPIIRMENTFEGTMCVADDVAIPEEVKKIAPERSLKFTEGFLETLKADKEILELFNVKIARDHFFYRKQNKSNATDKVEEE